MKTETVDAALCRGTLYTALTLGFRPPTPETLERLTDPQAAAALAAAAQVLDAQGAGSLRRRTLALAHPDSNLEALGAAHRRLFGHTARGEVPAYETEYGNEALFQQPQELSDLAGFMSAFGLALRREAHERIDHVSCECEFLAFLAYKEAYALDAGDEEMRAATVRAATLFLRDHLGRIAPAFARRVAKVDAGGVYAALADLLCALVAHDCRRLEVPIGPDGLGPRPDPATVAAPMGCAAECDAPCPT